jgi:hypothetical protein
MPCFISKHRQEDKKVNSKIHTELQYSVVGIERAKKHKFCTSLNKKSKYFIYSAI